MDDASTQWSRAELLFALRGGPGCPPLRTAFGPGTLTALRPGRDGGGDAQLQAGNQGCRGYGIRQAGRYRP